MVQDDGPVGLDGLKVSFDDERAVSDVGVALVATLAGRLGLEALASEMVQLRHKRPGAANAGRKVMAPLYTMALGADSIDEPTSCAPGAPGGVARLGAGALDAGHLFARHHVLKDNRPSDTELLDASGERWVVVRYVGHEASPALVGQANVPGHRWSSARQAAARVATSGKSPLR